MPLNLIDIIIPVHNGEAFIKEALTAAIEISDSIGCNIIVSLNACTDKTDEIISKIGHSSIKKIYTSSFINATENYFNCLLKSDAEYVVLCGADDILDSFGQKELMNFAERNKIKPPIIFGYDEVIDINGIMRRSHKFKKYWLNLTKEKIIKNAFGGYNPNLNGAWINRKLAIKCYNKNRKMFTDPLLKLQRVSDLVLWNCFAIQILSSCGATGFQYLPVRQILYREYFKDELKIKGDLTVKLSNHGRLAFLEYVNATYSRLFETQKKYASYGIKKYARNNFLIIFGFEDYQNALLIYKNLNSHGNLFVTEKMATFFMQNRYLGSIVLSFYKSRNFISLLVNRIKFAFKVQI